MNSKGSEHNPAVVSTSGEIFSDGTMLELVVRAGAPALLFWNGKEATVGQRFRHGGKVFQPAQIHPSVFATMLLPEGCSPCPPTSDLLDQLGRSFVDYLALEQDTARLFAYFALSTWICDGLMTAPLFVISTASDVQGANLLRVLRCFCRHALVLTHVRTDVSRYSLHLRPTLLLNVPNVTSSIAALLRASVHRGFKVAGADGEMVDISGAKAILVGMQDSSIFSGAGVIQIRLTPTRFPTHGLTEEILTRLAAEYQPALLSYRLRNWQDVRDSSDIPEFTFETRQLARSFLSSVGNDSHLAADLRLLLTPYDEETRAELSVDSTAAVIEVVLALSHEGAVEEIGIHNVADLVNSLLRARGRLEVYSPEEIGRKIKALGLRRHRTASGQMLLLNADTAQRVHELARALGLPLMQADEATCSECRGA